MIKRALMLIVVLSLAGCTTQDQETETKAVPVLETAPQIKDIPIYIESIGTLHPSAHVEIYSLVQGSLQDVYFREGAEVKKGDKLMDIDPRAFQVKVKEAEAQLHMDLVNLQSTQKKQERFRGLAQKDLVAQAEWDEFEADAARAAAVVELDQARLTAAKLELEHCTLAASIDGRVGKLTLVPGCLINASQSSPLATIDQIDPLAVEFSLTEHEVCTLPKENLKLEIHKIGVGGIEKDRAEGEITFLDHRLDAKTGQCFVRGTLKNPDHTLLPGQCVRIKIPNGFAFQSKLLPKKTIRYNEQGAYVYVIESDSTVGFRQLTLGDEVDNDIIVLEGIEPDDRVISDGHLRLSPGIKVEVKS